MKFTKGKTLLLESISNEPTLKGLDSIGDDYNKTTTGIPNKMMDYYFGIMRHKVALCKHVTLPSNTHVQAKVVAKIYGLIHTDSKKFPCTGCCVRSTSGIHEVAANMSLKILVVIFSAGEKKMHKRIVTRYGKRIFVSERVVLLDFCGLPVPHCLYNNRNPPAATYV